jgi:hypothetical protein
MPDAPTPPAWREITVRAVVNSQAGAELIPLLAQLMQHYGGITPVERAAVAAWFSATYGPQGGTHA